MQRTFEHGSRLERVEDLAAVLLVTAWSIATVVLLIVQSMTPA